jgi:lysozyme
VIAAKKLSRKGTKFIAGFEGFVATPYRDAVGVLTQGFGHTGSGIGGTWSRAHALDVLRQDAAPVARAVLRAKLASMKLRQHELDALVSFGFNLGPGYFERGHTMGDALHRGNHKRIAAAFPLYDQAGGHALPGLTRRRHAERHLFENGYRK